MAAKKVEVYSYPNGTNFFKALLAGKYGGVEVDYAPNFQMGVTNKSPEFLAKFPVGKVPAAETRDGPLFESNAIARYVARIGNDSAGLLGSTDYEKSLVDQWIDFYTFYIGQHTGPLIFWKFGWGSYDAEKFKASQAEVAKAFGWLEAHLSRPNATKFLVNDRVTLADIILVNGLVNPLKISLDAEFRKPFPKTEAYIKSVLAEPHFVAVHGDVVLLDKFVPPQ